MGITNTNPVNEYRTARVAEVLSDFQNIQYYIAAAPVDPLNMDDYYTEGWAALRQCNLDGQHILNCGADTSVPQARGGPEEQTKAELQQFVISPLTTRQCFCGTDNPPKRVLLDAFARRHEAQKIYLRQAAAQRWVDYREQVLNGGRPHSGNQSQLRQIDQQLRAVRIRLFVSLSPSSFSHLVFPVVHPALKQNHQKKCSSDSDDECR